MSVLVGPALGISFPGRDLGQMRDFASSRTPPTSDLLQTTLPLVVIFISLRTLDGVRMYSLYI